MADNKYNTYYERGKRDGEHDRYNPPSKSFVDQCLTGLTEREIDNKIDYDQGYSHGKR